MYIYNVHGADRLYDPQLVQMFVYFFCCPSFDYYYYYNKHAPNYSAVLVNFCDNWIITKSIGNEITFNINEHYTVN